MTLLVHQADSMDAGQPVRKVAAARLGMSYGQFKRAKFQGEILLDGERARADTQVQAGQVLVIRVPEPSGQPISPYSMPLSVPYQDEHFWAVDKPAPLPSVPSPRKETLTLENAVYAALGCPEGFLYRPVNRLDKGTSGLMLIAMNAHVQQRLQSMLHGDGFLREYLAICEGCPEQRQGTIDLPIRKVDAASIQREVHPKGKLALTHYEVLETANGRSLVRLRLETGRTHQIRVHMQALGCPVAGDFLYGKELRSLPGRFALHSCRVRVQHPITGEPVEVESPLPEPLAALMRESPLPG